MDELKTMNKYKTNPEFREVVDMIAFQTDIAVNVILGWGVVRTLAERYPDKPSNK